MFPYQRFWVITSWALQSPRPPVFKTEWKDAKTNGKRHSKCSRPLLRTECDAIIKDSDKGTDNQCNQRQCLKRQVERCPVPTGLHFNSLLLAELGQGLFDAQGRETGGSVGVPAFSHDLGHDP